MILGLDVSTSITGFCVIDANGEVIRCDAWDLRNKNKFKSEFEKAAHIKEQLLQIKAQYPIDRVFVEKPFTFFKSGGSSGKTMAILQRFNGIVSWLTNEVFDQEPEYLTASEARKLLAIKVERGKNAKKKVVEWLLENVSNFKVEYTPHGNPKPKYFDIGDAIVIAKAGLKKLGTKKVLTTKNQ